jgi:rhodanese-related sulfurtransferase
VNKALSKIIIIFSLVGIITLGWYKWSNDDNRPKLTDRILEKKLMVINVLDAKQYDDCHIKGSVHMSFDEYESYAQKLDKDTELVFYCSNYMCAGSGMAAKFFTKRGFKKVWAYEAGMAKWYKQGLPVVGPCKAAYLNMKNDSIEELDDSVVVITTQQLKDKLEF